MNIPDQYYDLILKEFKDVETLCSEAKTLDDKLYFLSASYGVLNRVMNFHCEPILVFMHQIIQSTIQAIVQRLGAPKKPGSINSIVPDEMLDAIFQYYSELIQAFEAEDDQAIRAVLEKISNLGYAMSGNGYYLYIRNKLTI